MNIVNTVLNIVHMECNLNAHFQTVPNLSIQYAPIYLAVYLPSKGSKMAVWM